MFFLLLEEGSTSNCGWDIGRGRIGPWNSGECTPLSRPLYSRLCSKVHSAFETLRPLSPPANRLENPRPRFFGSVELLILGLGRITPWKKKRGRWKNKC